MLYSRDQAVSPIEECIVHNATPNRLVKKKSPFSYTAYGHQNRGVWNTRHQYYHKATCELARTDKAFQVEMVLVQHASCGRSLLETLHLVKVGNILTSVVPTTLGELLSANDERQNWRSARILDWNHGYSSVAASHDATRRAVAASDMSCESSKSF
jgi:hypothetical protein